MDLPVGALGELLCKKLSHSVFVFTLILLAIVIDLFVCVRMLLFCDDLKIGNLLYGLWRLASTESVLQIYC